MIQQYTVYRTDDEKGSAVTSSTWKQARKDVTRLTEAIDTGPVSLILSYTTAIGDVPAPKETGIFALNIRTEVEVIVKVEKKHEPA